MKIPTIIKIGGALSSLRLIWGIEKDGDFDFT
jgi:hypothetical protein